MIPRVGRSNGGAGPGTTGQAAIRVIASAMRFIRGVLALLAIIALQTGWSRAVALVWLFNIVGTADLLNALRHVDVAPSFGAAWYIPTMLVPLLLVMHFMMLSRLFRGPGEGGWQLGPS